MEGVWVRSLVRELRSHKQCGRAKKISAPPKKEEEERRRVPQGKKKLSFCSSLGELQQKWALEGEQEFARQITEAEGSRHGGHSWI